MPYVTIIVSALAAITVTVLQLWKGWPVNPQ